MRTARRSFGATVCLVSAIACGRPQAAAPPAPVSEAEAPQPAESVVLEVENHNWSDIVV